MLIVLQCPPNNLGWRLPKLAELTKKEFQYWELWEAQLQLCTLNLCGENMNLWVRFWCGCTQMAKERALVAVPVTQILCNEHCFFSWFRFLVIWLKLLKQNTINGTVYVIRVPVIKLVTLLILVNTSISARYENQYWSGNSSKSRCALLLLKRFIAQVPFYCAVLQH